MAATTQAVRRSRWTSPVLLLAGTATAAVAMAIGVAIGSASAPDASSEPASPAVATPSTALNGSDVHLHNMAEAAGG